jgi:uncharacterized delta-60 repeat protein
MEELTMLPFNLALNRLSHILGASRRRGALVRRNRRRPRVELLEGRTLLTAGALDTSFGGTGLVTTRLAFNTYAQGLAIQPDLKTVVVGLEPPSNTTGIFPHSLTLFRYNVDGSLDSAFGTGGEVVLSTNTLKSSFTLHNASVAIQPDGKIVVATNTATLSGDSLTSCDMLVMRFNTNASLDTSFGSNGETVIHLAQGFTTARGVAVLSNGDIVVAGTDPRGTNYIGTSSAAVFVVARLTGSGALDTTFGPSSQGFNYMTFPVTTVVKTYNVDSLGVDASGNILLGGNVRGSSSPIDQVVRYTPSGLIDTSFGNQGVLDLPFGAPYGVEGIGLQSSGQIIAAFSSFNGAGTGGLVRLTPGGAVDTTFASNGYFSDPATTAQVDVAIQSDDKILLQTYNQSGGNSNGIAVDRLLGNGTLDSTFGTAGRAVILGNTGPPVGIAVGPDGKITGSTITGGTAPCAAESFRLLGDTPITGQIVVTTQPPAAITAGSSFGLTVAVDDSSGNIETSFNGSVTVMLENNPAGATLAGTLTVTASQGVASFSDLSLTTAASGYTILVSGNTLGAATTSAFTVMPLAASQVVVTQQPPSSVTAGAGFGLTAAIADMYGNAVTSANNMVSIALAANPGGSTLGGTLSIAASNGIATFSALTLTKAASGYTISVATSGLTGSTTSALAVIPAAATQLVIVTQPPSSVALNGVFGLVLAIEDAYGNIVTSANNSVTVAFGNNPTNAKLGGTTSVKATNGYVTFSNLSINKRGSGYTLKLTSTGLTSATTSAIQVI